MAEAAKKSRAVMKGKFTRTKNSLLRAIDRRTTLVTVKSRYKQFVTAWEGVQASFEEYEQQTKGEADESKWIDEVNTEYEEAEIIADTYIEQIESDIKLRERREALNEVEEQGKGRKG